MADVAVEVISPATSFCEAGKAVYAREQPRFSEPTLRAVTSANTSNKEMARRENPPAVKPPSVRKAWGRMVTPSDAGGVGEGGSESSQRKLEGKAANGKDGNTIEIPHDTQVCDLHLHCNCCSLYSTVFMCVCHNIYCVLFGPRI